MLAEILAFLESVGTVLISVLTAILEFFLSVPEWIGMLVASVAFIPSAILPFAMLGIFTTVLLLIMGRN